MTTKNTRSFKSIQLTGAGRFGLAGGNAEAELGFHEGWLVCFLNLLFFVGFLGSFLFVFRGGVPKDYFTHGEIYK